MFQRYLKLRKKKLFLVCKCKNYFSFILVGAHTQIKISKISKIVV
jgi:hypothetical protein